MRTKLVAAAIALAAVAAIVLLVRYGPAGAPSAERGLVLHLPLRQDLLDHSRFARPVTVTGKVHIEQGAARFPGEGSWLTLPHIPLEGRPFAVALWVKVAGTGIGHGLFEQKDEDVENRHLHLALSGWRPYFGFYENDARAKKYVPRDTWTHLVFVFTGQDQEIWVNGEAAAHSHSVAYRGRNGETHIGRHPRLPQLRASDLDGWLREVRVYEGVFEAERIRALYWKDYESMF
jgi:hypothetical protein